MQFKLKRIIKKLIRRIIYPNIPEDIINSINNYLQFQFNFKDRKFGLIGENVTLIPPIIFGNSDAVFFHGYNTIKAYSKFIMRPGYGKFIMKKRSGAAEGLTVVTNNHTYEPIIGQWHYDQRNNRIKESDLDVIVEEDVWIASNVTLLAGVTIGRGSILGSGAVCRHSVPPYSIVIGNPAKVVGFVLTPEEIIEHEKLLYPQEERLSIEKLNKNYEKYYLKRIKEIIKFVKL